MPDKLPVGIEDFKELRLEGFYYVDKTNLIRDILENWGKVNLFTRPRRFGKSLNMSMLRYFFEIGADRTLFNGLEISKNPALCEKYMGKFPVIALSLKDVHAPTYEMALDMLRFNINMETRRLRRQMKEKNLSAQQKSLLDRLESDCLTETELMNSLLLLSELLCQYYDRKILILIDEYDVPLDKAFEEGYLKQMISLIRNMFSKALKTNDYLYFAVLTGCLRISRESIFTGMNNFKIRSIMDVRFDEAFGFTDAEVKEMLACYGLEAHFDEIREWYDGYLFGEEHVYCPWDVINYCDKLRENPNARPEPFWINSSGNSIVKRFIHKAKKQTQREIEQLVAGEAVPKVISQELTYDELDNSIDNLWSVLFTTGYLTRRVSPGDARCHLVIPNLEIREIFVTQIMEWFRETVRQDRPGLDAFCAAFRDGEPEKIEQMFNSYLRKTISIRDTFVRKSKKENFYHGILLGLLSSEEDWILSSNAETGDGYSDILVENEEEGIGIVIEVKYAETAEALDAACREAVSQIVDTRYAQKLLDDGMKILHAFGIACHKKQCRVVYQDLHILPDKP